MTAPRRIPGREWSVIPDLELWHAHSRLRERLVAYAREQAGARAQGLLRAGGLSRPTRPPLRPDALTIGFARRFATYKRATLLFRDVERLKAILLDEARPVQLIIAGKAHPRDGAGKDFIRQLLDTVKREACPITLVFLEDYDLTDGHFGPGRGRLAQHTSQPL